MLLALPLALAAQTPPPTGIPPFSTVQHLPEGALNLGDLNLHLAFPIVNKAGRGTPLTYSLGFDSDIWAPVTNGKWTPSPTWGWTGETDAVTGYILYSAQTNECAYGQYPNLQYYHWTTYSDFQYVDTSGQAHSFSGGYLMEPPSPPFGLTCGPSGPSSYSASDGQVTFSVNESGGLSFSVLSTSGILFNPPAYQIGQHLANGSGSLTDANGNILSINGSAFTDTLGVAELSISGAGTPSSPIRYAIAGGGTDTVSYSSATVSTAFGCPNVSEFSGSADLPASVTLADGSEYGFGYGLHGRLTSITLPTGAAITYAYSGGTNGINCADGSPNTLTRTVNGNTWAYVHSITTAGGASVTTVTDPKRNVTVYGFYDGYEVQRQVYQGVVSPANLLETIFTCYNGSNCTATGGNGSFTLPITSRAVVISENGYEKETVTDYDANFDPIEVDQYDWASGAPGGLLRKTLITYAGLSGIADRPAEIEVDDGSGNLAAETTFAYDQGTLQSTSGLPQHTAPPDGSRGNLTTVQRCAALSGSACSNWLTTQLSYFDTGEIYQVTAPNKAATTYQYAAGSPGCAGAFPTTVTNALNQSSSAAWDCNGGVMTEATDLNGNKTTYAYGDPLWRLTQVTDPDGGGETIQYLSPTETEITTPISSSISETQYALLDSLGRPEFAQTADGSSCDTVETTYDQEGRVSGVSLPYSSSCIAHSGGTPEFTTTAYDALGRPTSVKTADGGTTIYAYAGPATTVTGPTGVARILQANGLGELADVCEVTNLSGSGACGLDASATGYLTTYGRDALGDLTSVSEDAQPGGVAQSRAFQFDALGRMLSEATPEASTTTFAYGTADSACGGYQSLGGLVEKKDNMGNITCLAYDPLGRVTAITYPSGPYAGATPPKTFIYDSATVDGQNMVNTAGRLAEAYTGPSGAKITDEGFGYDSMGRPTEFFESTPNSGGYYETQETYWQDGQRDTLALPWTPLITYTPDEAGQITSVTAASGQNPASSLAYSPAGQVTAITFGSSDSDAYQYDPATGRMTQYLFTVNGATDTGNLTWNTDGTLGSLDIADNIPGTSDTQDCTYSHDDLGRLSGVNCPNIWSQSFTYDAFGNIAKSGSLAWQANYSAGNHASLASYDADGNVTADGLNTYAWNAAGRMTTVSGDQFTRDALGREVQESANSELRFYFAPDGAIAGEDNACCGIRGQYVWLPGGGAAFYDCCGVFFYEHAGWLGSWRTASLGNRTLFSSQALAPFGTFYAHGGPQNTWSFTGKTSPLSLGVGSNVIYDFPFRRLSPTQSRWLSPDPAGMAAVNPANPQTWNEYAYVGNQPLSATDPLGLFEPPGGIGPGPCDPNEIGWDWPAPGCSGWPPWPPILYPILPGGGSGGVVVSGGGTAAPGPCTAPLCLDLRPSTQGYTIQFPLLVSPLFRYAANVWAVLGRVPWSLTVGLPLPETGFTAGPVATVTARIGHWACVGYGLGIGTPGKIAASAGPLFPPFGPSDAEGTVNGESVSIVIQPLPTEGGQAIASWPPNGGLILGPTVGTPGASISYTNSRCWGR